VSPILYITAPAPDDRCRDGPLGDLARKAGWAPIFSVAQKSGMSASLELVDRLDPHTDALLMLPHWIESHAAMQEYNRAETRGIERIKVSSIESIPPASARTTCPHYERAFVGIGLCSDLCNLLDAARCPIGKTCPIRRRCR